MKELFGIPMSGITVAMVVLLGVALAVTAFIAISNKTMFRMGTRNIPRRRTQSGLIVFGLMLSTLIITAAFVTGDTIDHSLTKGSYDLFQRSDLDISWNGERNFLRDQGATDGSTPSYIDESVVESLDAAFASDPAIDGFLPWLYTLMPARNVDGGNASPALQLVGYDPARLTEFGGLHAIDGDAENLDISSDAVFISRRTAKDLALKAGDTIALYGPGGPQQFHVAAVVEDELASGVLGFKFSSVPGGVAMPIDHLRSLMGLHGNETSVLTVALHGDVHSTVDGGSVAATKVQEWLDGDGAGVFAAAGLPQGRAVEAFDTKAEAVRASELNGNFFVAIFIILGLFSIAAGILLIFMILVMLASERRPEMGMARAVGAQRKHLLQAFIAEGMAYSLLAGTVGVIFGVFASLGLTNVLLPAFDREYFSIVEPKVTWQAIVVGYSLGVVVTFITVVIAAMRVTHINIVAAIRGLPEGPRPARKRRTSWKWIALSVPAMVVPPLGLWWLLRKGFGISKTWILGPAGVVSGALLILLGQSSDVLAYFALGVSLIPLSVAAMVLRWGFPARGTWTAVGVLLLAYWLLPPGTHDALFGEFKTKGDEMFVLSGLMLVVGATLVIAFNGGIITSLFGNTTREGGARRVPLTLAIVAGALVATGLALGDYANGVGQLAYMVAAVVAAGAVCALAAAKFSSAAPALKIAIAYPMASRFRTGMTIAMFSLIVFSLTAFSILIANFGAIEGGDEARGGVDVITTRTDGSDVGELVGELNDDDAARVDAAGELTLPHPGQQAFDATADEWLDYPVIAGDAAFFDGVQPTLDSRAYGYGSDEAALAAVGSDSSLALIDIYGSGQGFSEMDWSVHVKATDGYFEPFDIQVRNAETGETETLTVVGVLRIGLQAGDIAGIYVNEQSYSGLFGTPIYQKEYLRLADGTDARDFADTIEASLATRGVEARSVEHVLAQMSAQQTAFNRMFQAFMALGLVVGIAGLGVVSFRSVVERRQQIGMLRAIGFQRGTVCLSFLVESAFIAVMGILSGVVCGTVLSRNLLTSDSFTQGETVNFSIPWVEVAGLAIASLLVALLMTWWPSRGAARVPVAEALRYE